MTTLKSRIGDPMFDIMRARTRVFVSNALRIGDPLPDSIGAIQAEVWNNLAGLLQDVKQEHAPDMVWSIDAGRQFIGNVLSGMTIFQMLSDEVESQDHVRTVRLRVERTLDERLRQGDPRLVDERIKEGTPWRVDQEFQQLFDQFECRYNTDNKQYQWYDTRNGTWGGKC